MLCGEFVTIGLLMTWFDGSINGECFRAYVEQLLLPTLKSGDIVIMDNLCRHKSKAVRSTIHKAGAKLWFLPKYSPDLNPIERVFASINAMEPGRVDRLPLWRGCARS